MKYILLTFLLACGPKSGQYDVVVSDSNHTIHIINPIIEFCERLYPIVLYPDEVEREQFITSCMKLCSESGQCEIMIPPDIINNNQ